jgi:hypothetical protein
MQKMHILHFAAAHDLIEPGAARAGLSKKRGRRRMFMQSPAFIASLVCGKQWACWVAWG